jgi:hypothetical protein
MKISNENRLLLETHPTYILVNRYKNDITKLLERYPDGVPDHISSAALGLTLEEFEVEYQNIVTCLRQEMRV